METALLGRGFLLLVAVLVEDGVIDVNDQDPGRQEIARELRAIAQTYGEGARARADYHKSIRGQKALARALAEDEREPVN